MMSRIPALLGVILLLVLSGPTMHGTGLAQGPREAVTNAQANHHTPDAHDTVPTHQASLACVTICLGSSVVEFAPIPNLADVVVVRIVGFGELPLQALAAPDIPVRPPDRTTLL